MPQLTVGGTTIPVARRGVQQKKPVEVGDRFVAFDGTERTSITARKKRWEITTSLLNDTDYSSVKAALEATPPLACDGDILDNTATNCNATIRGTRYVSTPGGKRRAITFELRER